jgi:hypothetical protein
LTGDLDRDLHAVVVALQAENGGHGVDLNAPPLVVLTKIVVDVGATSGSGVELSKASHPGHGGRSCLTLMPG